MHKISAVSSYIIFHALVCRKRRVPVSACSCVSVSVCVCIHHTHICPLDQWSQQDQLLSQKRSERKYKNNKQTDTQRFTFVCSHKSSSFELYINFTQLLWKCVFCAFMCYYESDWIKRQERAREYGERGLKENLSFSVWKPWQHNLSDPSHLAPWFHYPSCDKISQWHPAPLHLQEAQTET